MISHPFEDLKLSLSIKIQRWQKPNILSDEKRYEEWDLKLMRPGLSNKTIHKKKKRTGNTDAKSCDSF